MKRDMDLVRAILLKIESDPSTHGGRLASGANCFMAMAAADFGLDPAVHSDEEVAYHVRMLIEEGFIDGDKASPVIRALTWKGHEFLDTVRDGEIWRLTKEGAKHAGVASVQALLAIGTAVARQKLAELGISL